MGALLFVNFLLTSYDASKKGSYPFSTFSGTLPENLSNNVGWICQTIMKMRNWANMSLCRIIFTGLL